ncbi:MAG: arginine--tRNA ligase [Acidimicrobiales bacterium]
MVTDSLTEALRAALRTCGVDAPDTIQVERPARREHGDWSSNVALVSAKAAGRNPRELAADLVAALEADPAPHVVKVEIAGPGFVNFHLDDGWLHDVLTQVVTEGADDYATPDLGGGKKVMVEFVSANPTGPLHAGHARGAVYGDSLARLLARTGHDVSREFYVNDRGAQIQHFADSLVARKAGEEPDDDGYQGAYISEWAVEMPDDADPVTWGLARARQDQIDTLAGLGVAFDVWFSESSLADSGAIEQTLADLLARDAPDKPEDADEWKVAYEADGATWLRSTVFGDDKDRVLVKTDGEYTYVLPDIAYHADKFARGFDLLINVWGADHHGYVSRLKNAVQALGHDPDELEIVITQLVSLFKNGEPVRLSKRTGQIVTIDEIVDEIGADSARITFLLQSMDSPQTVDLAEVASQAMENPVFYVQYAHARIRSIGRKVAELRVERAPLADVDLGLLTHERELELLRSLSELPEVVAGATLGRAPHQVTTWVRELAGRFHGFYHDCYVVADSVDPALTQARLWLVEAVRIGLAIGLDLLGASAPDEM